jgi:hypothetical protein
MLRQSVFVAIAMLLFTDGAFAADKAQKDKKEKDSAEKVVTAGISVYSGNATIVAHYLDNQEYNGPTMGLTAEFGAMYKRSENLSWDLDMTYLGSSYSSGAPETGVSNPAGTSGISMNRINADYGTYYNWNPIKNLSIKAGGSFDLLGGLLNGVPNHVNNSIELDLQMQLKAGAGVRYGWNIKDKVGIFLQANLEIPFLGCAISGSKYESSTDALVGGDVLPGSIKPICFTSFHNLNGFNADVEAELILKKTTLFYALEWNHRSWYLHDVQNVRNFNMTKLGVKVDLVARNRINTQNRFF